MGTAKLSHNWRLTSETCLLECLYEILLLMHRVSERATNRTNTMICFACASTIPLSSSIAFCVLLPPFLSGTVSSFCSVCFIAVQLFACIGSSYIHSKTCSASTLMNNQLTANIVSVTEQFLLKQCTHTKYTLCPNEMRRIASNEADITILISFFMALNFCHFSVSRCCNYSKSYYL